MHSSAGRALDSKSKSRRFKSGCVQSVFRDSIVASISACHAGDRGSIPRRGAYFCGFFGSLALSK